MQLATKFLQVPGTPRAAWPELDHGAPRRPCETGSSPREAAAPVSELSSDEGLAVHSGKKQCDRATRCPGGARPQPASDVSDGPAAGTARTRARSNHQACRRARHAVPAISAALTSLRERRSPPYAAPKRE